MVWSRGISRCVLAPLPFVAVLATCSPGGDAAPDLESFLVRDSAGITIAESSSPAWDEGERWTLIEEPLLSIGMVEGPDEYILYHVVSAVRLEDGRIVVADGGSRSLKVYDGAGDFLMTAGSRGEGPGEFEDIGFIYRLGTDSLAVLDFRFFRVSVFDESVAYARDFRLAEGSNELPFPNGVFSDGTILASVRGKGAGDFSELGVFRDEIQFQLYDRDGDLLRNLTTRPGSESYRGTNPDGSDYTFTPNYAARPWIATGTSSWFYGPGDAFEIQEWGMGGHLLRIFRLDQERRAMPQEVITAWEEGLLEMSPDAAALRRAMPLPDYLPAHEWITVDGAGNLWMSEYVVLNETPRWSVFHPSGRWLGKVSVPPGGRITEIGEDYVLGVWKDEMDVEVVRLYGLIKPEAM